MPLSPVETAGSLLSTLFDTGLYLYSCFGILINTTEATGIYTAHTLIIHYRPLNNTQTPQIKAKSATL